MKWKNLLNMFLLVMNIILYLHWFACFWNLTVLYNGPKIYFVQADGSYKDLYG